MKLYQAIIFISGFCGSLFSLVMIGTLDVQAVTSLTIPIMQDTYVEEGYPGIAPWNNRNLYVGWNNFYGKARTRLFLQPDLSVTKQMCLLPEEITATTLNLWQYMPPTVSRQIRLYEVKSSWNHNTLNWLTQPVGINLKNIGVYSLNTNKSWQKLNISTSFKNSFTTWQQGTKFYGWAIYATNEYATGSILWSTECAVAPNAPKCINEVPSVKLTINQNQLPTAPLLVSPVDGLQTNVVKQIFIIKPSIDPEADPIEYQLNIFSDKNLQTIVHKSIWQTALLFNPPDLIEGEYYWQVKSRDNHKCLNVGMASLVNRLIIDLTPPTRPPLDTEPPYTSGNQNTIFWQASVDNSSIIIQYEAQVSSLADFINPHQILNWKSVLYYTFTNLKEQNYFYRVRAKDQAGNISAWSDQTDSIQDQNPPQLKYFKSSQQYISPTNKTSLKKQDFTTLTAEIIDTTLSTVELVIINEGRTNIFNQQQTTGIVNQIWPSSTDKLPDGRYFAYIKASDQFNRLHYSEPLILILDDTSPQVPQFINIKSGLLTRQKDILSTGKSIGANHLQFKLNGKFLSNNQGSNWSLRLKNLADGFYKLAVIATDKAANQSNNFVTFTIDHTAPVMPQIKAIVQSGTISLQIKGELNTTAFIYLNGRLTKQIKLIKDQQIVPVISPIRDGKQYQLFVNLKDLAGNVSLSSRVITKRLFLGIGGSGQKEKSLFPQINNILGECHVIMNYHTKKLSEATCTNNSLIIGGVKPAIIKTRIWDLNTYVATSKKAKLLITIIECKPFSLWEIATWWGRCVEHVTVKRYDSKSLVSNKLSSIVENKQNKKVQIEAYTQKNYQWKSETQVFMKSQFTTSAKQAQIQIKSHYEDGLYESKSQAFYNFKSPENLSAWFKFKLPVTRPKNQPYFDWIFKKNIGVTQWHGNTVYQKPHYGIDIGAFKEPIYAPADGVIYNIGFDKYGGECYQGGRFVAIKHSNGMFSMYFHLQDYKKSSGQNWQRGQKIRRGEKIGVTGNSGKYDCQPLGYHVHFEIRSCASSRCHVNPVPNIAMDWRKIKTLGAVANPGRLTGDNPHPGW